MKSKKIALITALIVGVGVLAACAAPVVTAAATEKTMAKRAKCAGYFLGLDLTDDQKAHARRIFEAHKAEVKAVKENSALTREQKLEGFREIRQAGVAEFRKILTPEQQQKFDEHVAQCEKLREGRRDQIRDKLQSAAAELNLTDDQKARIKEIMASHKDEFQALRADQSLTREQRIARLKEMKETVKAEIRSTLTPEQQQKFDQMTSRFETRFIERTKTRARAK